MSTSFHRLGDQGDERFVPGHIGLFTRCFQLLLQCNLLVALASLVFAPSAMAVEPSVDEASVTAGAVNPPATVVELFPHFQQQKGQVGLVVCSWAPQSLTATVSDNTSDVYTAAIEPVNFGPNFRGQVWYGRKINSGLSKVEITMSGTTTGNLLCWFWVVNGVDPNSPLDPAVTHAFSGHGSLMKTSLSGFPSTSNEMIWGLFLTDTPATPFTPAQGWSSISGQEAVSELEWKLMSPEKQQPSATNGNDAANWLGIVIGLKTQSTSYSPRQHELGRVQQ